MGNMCYKPQHNINGNRERMKNAMTALLDSIEAGNVDDVKILAQQCDVRLPALPRGTSSPVHPIWFACYQRHGPYAMEAILKALIAAGANVNQLHVDGQQRNPLVYAVETRNMPLCRTLLELGSTCEYYAGEDAMTEALITGPAYVSLCLEHCAPLDNLELYVYKSFMHANSDVLDVLMDWYELHNKTFAFKLGIDLTFIFRDEATVLTILQREYHLFRGDTYRNIKKWFRTAAFSEYEGIMKLLIEQRPQILQAPWLRSGEIADQLQVTRHQEFLRSVKSLQSQPLSLQMLCKMRIGKKLGPAPESKIDQLPLPRDLKAFLKEKNTLLSSPIVSSPVVPYQQQ